MHYSGKSNKVAQNVKTQTKQSLYDQLWSRSTSSGSLTFRPQLAFLMAADSNVQSLVQVHHYLMHLSKTVIKRGKKKIIYKLYPTVSHRTSQIMKKCETYSTENTVHDKMTFGGNVVQFLSNYLFRKQPHWFDFLTVPYPV